METLNTEFNFKNIIEKQVVCFCLAKSITIGELSNCYLSHWSCPDLNDPGVVNNRFVNKIPQMFCFYGKQYFTIDENDVVNENIIDDVVCLFNQLRTLLAFSKISDVVSVVEKSKYISITDKVSWELIKTELAKASEKKPD